MSQILKIFKGKSKSSKKDEKPSSSCADASVSTASVSISEASSTKSRRSRSNSTSKKSSKSKSNKQPTGGGTADTLTPNEQVAARYFELLNAHAPVEDIIEMFTSSDAVVKFDDDTDTMNAIAVVTEVRKCYLGFEDLKFEYECVKELKPGYVCVENLMVSGTHTKPFQFAGFPFVEPTQKHVELDPEFTYFTVKDGKIDMLHSIAMGSLTGPIGLYINVGGKMEMPPTPAPPAE